MKKKLQSIIDYKKISYNVHQYNKEEFIKWRASLGQNYTNVISNLRWHNDWAKRPKACEMAINKWLESENDGNSIPRSNDLKSSI